MRGQHIRLILVCLVAVAASFGAGLAAISRALEGQTRQLADGSLLRLEAVTYERQHLLIERSWWQKLLGPLLPPQLQVCGGYSFNSDTDQLAFWLFRRGIPAGKNWQGCAAVAVDEHGCCIGRGEAGVAPPSRSGPAVEAIYGALDAFPRRADTLRLRVFPNNALLPITEFRVVNPRPGPYPNWPPDPLPITRRQGELQVTLSALTTGLSWPELLQSQPPLPPARLQRYIATLARYRPSSRTLPAPWEAMWTRASFRILEQGRASRNWRLEGVSVADATGNTLQHRVHDFFTCLRGESNQEGKLWFAFHGGLCPRESAWKVRAYLPYAGPPDSRRADLRWTVRHVRVPPRGDMTALDATTTQQGVTLRLRGVFGPGAPSLDALRGPLKTMRARVEIRRPAGERLRLLACAIDEAGRGLGIPSSSVFSGDERDWWPTLDLPPGARTITLTFAAWKERVFEFVARPSS